MINCDGMYIFQYLSDADIETIKNRIALINYPAAVRSLRIHPMYWGRDYLKDFMQFVHYIRPRKAKLMLSLPNNHFDALPISCGVNGVGTVINESTNPYDDTTSISRATEVLEFFMQFKISYRKFQVNEPFSSEYSYETGALLSAQNGINAKYTLDAYKAALNAKNLMNRKLFGCQALHSGDWIFYNTANYPRDLHLALDLIGNWESYHYPKYLKALELNPKYLMCSESGAWDTNGYADKSANFWSETMKVNGLWIAEFCARIEKEFCWHNLASRNVMNDGSCNSLFSKTSNSKTAELNENPLISEQFIR